ncbi:MAG: SGNH/GDSL hydrolase family protein [Victivallales bacterium]|nr:SGNH/GDSL hydrolase family protein [Victivallales bacterium]
MKTFLAFMLVFLTCTGWEVFQNQFLGGDFESRNDVGYGMRAFTTGAGVEASLAEGALCLKLKPGRSNAQVLTILRGKQFPGGTCVQVKARIRGKGKVQFGFAGQMDMMGCGKEEGLWKTSLMLSDDWKSVNYDFDFSKTPMDRPLLLLRLLQDGTELHIDDLQVLSKWDDAVKISTRPGCILNEEGTPLEEIVYDVNPWNAKGQFLWSDTFREMRSFPAEAKEGHLAFKLPDTPSPGLHRLILTVKGLSVPRDVLVISKEEKAQLETKAQKSGIGGNVLVIGDSLSDFSRGHNWVDICQGLLGATVTFFNVACGGDHTSRIAHRLTSKGHFYRDEMYEEIRTRKYDRILIFLGQNDTVSFEKDKYAAPQIPANAVKKYYEMILTEIRRFSNAPVTIFSGVSTPQEVNDKNMATYHYRFGIPKFVEAYNSAVQETCKKYNCTYFDIYTPFSALEDKASFFREDGVHLSIKGNLYLARLVLDNL